MTPSPQSDRSVGIIGAGRIGQAMAGIARRAGRQVVIANSRGPQSLAAVVDAIGGTSLEAHRAGLVRVVQAGAQPISWVSLACELQRDWARLETVPAIVEIVLNDRLLKE